MQKAPENVSQGLFLFILVRMFRSSFVFFGFDGMPTGLANSRGYQSGMNQVSHNWFIQYQCIAFEFLLFLFHSC